MEKVGSAGRTVIEVEGVFDLSSTPEIRRRLLKVARNRGVRILEIDLSKVPSMDTSCVAVLVEVLGVLRGRGADLRLTGFDRSALRMISLARLESLFEGKINVE